MTTGRLVAGIAGLILLVAAVLAWFVSPVITAVLVGAAVVLMSGWQLYRRGKNIPAAPENTWTTLWLPVTYGCLAVVALNGWIYRVSRDSDGGSDFGPLIGLVTGVIGMAAAYGYGRLRAQKAQLAALDDPAVADGTETAKTGARRVADEDELDPNEWLQNWRREDF